MVFHFVPECGVAKAFLDGFGHGQLCAVDAKTVSDVFKNGFRERIRALENHANAAAQLSNILFENVFAIEKDFAFEAGVAHGFVHAVERAQEWICRSQKGR